ncbi:hypothetical protein KEM55_003930 [Ascosphaera atra]|nr:hypothetical protein KEM55_003930 [Ascosphaera atra]
MSDLRLSMLVLYVLMMYVSVYPVVITMRNSNVYEERSLGLFPDFASKRSRTITAYRRIRRSFRKSSTSSGRRRSAATTGTDISNNNNNGATRPPSVFSERTIDNDADAYNDTTNPDESRAYFIRHQIHSQLAHDLWWVSLAVLLVTIVETTHVDRDPITYSVFNIIFELISGYGCVGVSTGLPGKNYSFSGGWHTLSKLIICAVMIRGRHRGLPAAIDRAICLPGEHLAVAEEEDQLRRLETRGHAHAHGHAHGDAGTIV